MLLLTHTVSLAPLVVSYSLFLSSRLPLPSRNVQSSSTQNVATIQRCTFVLMQEGGGGEKVEVEKKVDGDDEESRAVKEMLLVRCDCRP